MNDWFLIILMTVNSPPIRVGPFDSQHQCFQALSKIIDDHPELIVGKQDGFLLTSVRGYCIQTTPTELSK